MMPHSTTMDIEDGGFADWRAAPRIRGHKALSLDPYPASVEPGRTGSPHRSLLPHLSVTQNTPTSSGVSTGQSPKQTSAQRMMHSPGPDMIRDHYRPHGQGPTVLLATQHPRQIGSAHMIPTALTVARGSPARGVPEEIMLSTPSPAHSAAGHPADSLTSSRTVTVTGTIKRGQKAGDLVEVQLQLTQDEMDRLNQSSIMMDKENQSHSKCGLRKGGHILLLTLLYIPFAFLSSLCVSFYIGTMCWYNVYLCLSEERTVWHKVFLCPLLILFYPVLVVLAAVGVALVAAGKQVSWYLSSWLKEISDFEKGFFGWLCHQLGVPECSPYEVVILQEDNSKIYSAPVPQETGSTAQTMI